MLKRLFHAPEASSSKNSGVIMQIIFILLATLLFSNVSRAEMLDTKYETAVFAGGCFWCMEKPFEHLEGVISAISGYTGGHIESPSYKDVRLCRKIVLGHLEDLY
jgi:hypothetical protein